MVQANLNSFPSRQVKYHSNTSRSVDFPCFHSHLARLPTSSTRAFIVMIPHFTSVYLLGKSYRSRKAPAAASPMRRKLKIGCERRSRKRRGKCLEINLRRHKRKVIMNDILQTNQDVSKGHFVFSTTILFAILTRSVFPIKVWFTVMTSQ